MADLLSTVRRHRLSLFALGMVVLVTWLVWTRAGRAAGIRHRPGTGLHPRSGGDPPRAARHAALGRGAGGLRLVVALVWVLIAFALPPIGRQARELIERGPEFGAAIGAWEADLARWYAALSLPPELRDMIDASVARGREAFARSSGAAGPVVDTLVRTATFVLGLVIMPVWLFFVLKDREAFPEPWHPPCRPPGAPTRTRCWRCIARVGGRWVRGQLLLGASIFAASAIGLTFLTLIGFRELGEFTLVLALIAGVLEWFPIIGPIIAAVPAILIGLTIGSPAAIAAVDPLHRDPAAREQPAGPKVMGDAVELHPAVMILALVMGGALFGIGGAILAAPAVAAGRDLYRYGFRRLSGTSESAVASVVQARARARSPSPARSRTRGHRPTLGRARGCSTRRGTAGAARRAPGRSERRLVGVASGPIAGCPSRTAGDEGSSRRT